MAAKQKLLKPIHPGEILLEEFMKPIDISINRLARDIAVPRAASAPSSIANAPSAPIPPCASASTSASHPNSGWGFRLTTICTWRNVPSVPRWKNACIGTPPDLRGFVVNKKPFEKFVGRMRAAGKTRRGKRRVTGFDKKHAKALEGTLTEWLSKQDEKAYHEL